MIRLGISQQARPRHRPPAAIGRRRHDRALCSRSGHPQDPDPHQQHQSRSWTRTRPSARNWRAPGSRSPTTAWKSSCRAARRAPWAHQKTYTRARDPGPARNSRRSCAPRAALPHPSPLPRRHERRGTAPASRCRAGCSTASTTRSRIPLKDAAILSNCPDRDVRREWIQRIIDHDGRQGTRAASKPGCGSARRWASRARRSPRSSTCCRACASRWTPTSTSRARARGRKR